MNQNARAMIVMILSSLLWMGTKTTLADETPTTQPAKTGKFGITFTQRSPLSSRAELARRLNLKQAMMGEDYDLAKRPYRIYVPSNYDPSAPCGIFVYLGYKDAVSTPPLWNTALDKAHLIFITPVCHTGAHYPNSVPLWQTTGLALDAVYNLKQKYAIDDRRLYLMSFTDGAMQTALATSDSFTGSLVCMDINYYRKITLPDRSYIPPTFTAPPASLMSTARQHPFFMIDDGEGQVVKSLKLIVTAMKQDGFEHVMQTSLSIDGEVHYPNFKPEWFEQKALPFLDSASQKTTPPAPTAQAPVDENEPAATSAPSTTPQEPQAAKPEPRPAEHLMTMAQLYINGGQTDLAKSKLQEILDTYPDDPLAPKAKTMLDQLNGQ